MSDHFHDLVGSTQGEGPSSEFVATLRERIVAERADATADDSTVVDIAPLPEQEPKMSKTTLRLIGLAAAALLLIIGIAVIFSGDGDETDNIIIDNATTSVETDATTSVAPTTTAAPVVTEQEVSVIEDLLSARTAADLATTMTADGYASVRSRSGFLIESDEQLDSELSSLDVLGVVYTSSNCEPVPGSVRCDLTLETDVTKARGEDPVERVGSFIFEDGLISVWPNLPGFDFDIGSYAASAGLTDTHDAVCPADFSLPVQCAQFVADNLDGWMTWEQEQ